MSFKGNDMLLRVLAEGIKKEKLEERELSSFNQISNPIASKSDLDDDEKFKKSAKYFNKDRGFKKNGLDKDWISNALDVAAFSADELKLDLKDALMPFVDGDSAGQEKVLKVINQLKASGDSKKTKELFNTYTTSIEKVKSGKDAEERKAIYDALISDYVDDGLSSTDDNALDPFGVPQVASQVASSATFDDKSLSKFTGKVETAPGIIELFAAVEGTSFTKKLETLNNFGQKIKNETEIAAYMTEIENNPQESFKFMNTAAAYLALIDLSKQYDGVSAGMAFEKYLAVLLNAPVIGGANGAADNIAKTTGSSIVYLSAKSYKASGLDNVGQSVTGPEGLANLIGPGLDEDNNLGSSEANKGRSVFYITLAKKRKQTSEQVDMQYNTIDLYLTRVYFDFDQKEFYSEYLTAENNGDAINAYARHQMKREVARNGTSSVRLFKDFKGSLLPTYVLAAPSGDDEDMELTQKFLKDQTENITNTVIVAVKKAYVNSQKIEDGVRGYTAKKSSGNEAVDFVDQLKKSFQLLFDSLSGMFDEGSTIATNQDEEDMVSDFKKGVTESRKLTDVIKEITEKQLKKR